MAILYFFIHLGPMMLHKKIQVILIRNEGMMVFFVISHCHNIYKNKKWVCMGMSGYLWVYMGMYGFIWVCMGRYGYIWVCMGMYGYI